MIRLIHIPVVWLLKYYINKLRKKDLIKSLTIGDIVTLQYLVLSLKSIRAVNNGGWKLDETQRDLEQKALQLYMRNLESTKRFNELSDNEGYDRY